MDAFKNKKILVTGGYGFIGSHLVKKLLQYDAKIYIITMPDTNKFRLLDSLDKIITYETDIGDSLATGSVIRKINPDYVFHLAGYGINSAHTDYERAISTNVLGSANIMKALCETECKKMINMGSCSEYGNSKTDEGALPAPVTIYGSTKAAATLILHQIAKENRISIVTLRPFGVFGEGEEPHKVFSYVILNLLRKNNVALTGCEQYRDYCHVENIIDAMLLVCIRPDIENEIFNIASGESHPLYYYIDLIYKLMGTDTPPIYGTIPYRKAELWNPKTDAGKIKSMLNWNIKVPLEEGILQTIGWYRNNMNMFEV